jgi:alkylation response protein AidB-like acyl-CoA dehydrogenase
MAEETRAASKPREPAPAPSSPDLDGLRAEVRSFLAERAPKMRVRSGVRTPESREQADVLRRWSAALYEAGYYGADWPVEFGGRGGVDPLAEFVVSEEVARARAPTPIGAGSLAAHAILGFGSPEQQRRFLPRIRAYDDVWCQLFSEPEAGSDLASMKARAERDGDVFVLNGQKVWSTNAAFAERGYLLARTDPDVVKQAGITAFALDMSLPGIDVRPLREMTGTSDFNEVFFDDVRIPAGDVIGTVNDGWRVATTSLSEERAGVGAFTVALRLNFDALVELARSLERHGRPATEDLVVRQALAGFAARVEIASWFAGQVLARRRRGEIRAQDAPISKVVFAELNEELSTFAIGLQGARGTLSDADPQAFDEGRWQDVFLNAKAFTISAGSNEIMRNLLGERALLLPRG